MLVLALLARSARFRNWVRSLDLRTLTLLQTWRAVGLAFLALWSVGALPGGFALPASYGDVAVGVTAPFVAAFILGRGRAGRVAYLGWTAFGIIDLLAAITLGILYSPTSVGVLSGGAAGPGVMGQLPMSLIPTFGVPFTLALHAISVYAAWQADWTAPGARRVATPVGKVAAGR
ncbi:hypothetical protein [Ornithinimicrobium cavernae]|uniref:hypothetical protein n=1 Tax=Ornithinimicrobium cavernae TaxID=2666047 RepID=UPI00192A34F4|nr:hypothetical protein [Ornithinimicrobium cavernae]